MLTLKPQSNLVKPGFSDIYWHIFVFPRSLTLGQTLVTSIPLTALLHHTEALYWDFSRGHLLYIESFRKQIHVLDLQTGQDVFITTGKYSYYSITAILCYIPVHILLSLFRAYWAITFPPNTICQRGVYNFVD